MQNRWEQREAKRIKRNLEKVESFSLSDLLLRSIGKGQVSFSRQK